MRSAVVTFLVAMVLTAMLTPLVRWVALVSGAVDVSGTRSAHMGRIPRLGGIAIVGGFFAPLVALYALGAPIGRALFSGTTVMEGLLIGALLLIAVGILDDVRGVGAKYKLFVQIVAATAAYACGMRISAVELPWVGVFHLGWLAWPATTLWFVAIVNAINLIDGLDGLAAGVVFFACLTNFVIAALAGNYLILFVTASLGGAVIGFLFYNFNPARIFMGDTGSMFLGFVLAAASLLGAGSQKTPTLVAIIVPILALGLPITDMLVTIARRFFARRSIFAADREHIHHRLLDVGLTHRRAVLSLYLASVLFTALALVVHLGRSWQIGLALFVLSALLFGVVRFMNNLNSPGAAVSRAASQERAETLRRCVPRALVGLSDATSLEKLKAALGDLGEEAGLLCIAIVCASDRKSQRLRWHSSSAASSWRDEACTKFDITDGREALEVQFFTDGTLGIVGPTTRILLQLIADAAEASLIASLEQEEVVPSAIRPEGRILLPGQ
jgi:UDP-GlcNAc:undecaprenyl-phosphate GlcNAc-1-phosphate transferase